MSEVIDKKILKALSVDARQDIIKKLSKRPYTASELSKLMNKHVTTVTEHLKNLEEAGLVKKTLLKINGFIILLAIRVRGFSNRNISHGL